MIDCIGKPHNVQFWETSTGAATWSFDDSLLVTFSPTDPDVAALVRSGSIHLVKRDSFKGKTWGGQTSLDSTPVGYLSFDSNGKIIVMSWDKKHLLECDPGTSSNWSKLRNSEQVDYPIASAASCPIKLGLFVVGDERGGLDIVSNDRSTGNLESLCRLNTVNSAVRVSACAWSQDGKWIATGDDVGDVFLWNAHVPTSVSFAMALPRIQLNQYQRVGGPTTSLFFLPDSTALMILSDGYLSVWDIERVEYVTNSGLPSYGVTNIALDGPQNRLAVVTDDYDKYRYRTAVIITIYELKLREEMAQMAGKSSPQLELLPEPPRPTLCRVLCQFFEPNKRRPDTM